ncbi:CLUMA_CG009308, isoform A [Clunio marinus]|uniref:CLUMA_CG009308, isoform A n=1 Tax=Clunio marinus TaxID=568069 RepID=A0A1J1I6D7_9DIPT|nr:CLUMA_CG009308, isoform A [Clunio marinus]
MHSLSMAIIALLAISTLPILSFANTTEGTELEEPKTLPLTNAAKADEEKQMKNVNEIWQEDVHEVVIRKQRGAKDNVSGTTSGKKKERKDKHGNGTTKVPKTNKNLNTNLEANSDNTTHDPIGKKHHHQSKHEKTNNSKKHTSTIKPKPKDENSCRYTKGAWSECDSKSNTRSRTLTLKKGEGSCVQTRTIQKKCKKGKSEKACRYDKGAFGECQPSGEMTRIDKLKTTSDSASCPATRTINKKCNKSKQEKQPKDRNSKEKKQKERKNRQ